MFNDSKNSESHKKDESRISSDGIDLGTAIFNRYSPDLSLISSGSELGKRTAIFGINRLPLVHQIQQRWTVGNMQSPTWSAMRHALIWDSARHRTGALRRGPVTDNTITTHAIDLEHAIDTSAQPAVALGSSPVKVEKTHSVSRDTLEHPSPQVASAQ